MNLNDNPIFLTQKRLVHRGGIRDVQRPQHFPNGTAEKELVRHVRHHRQRRQQQDDAQVGVGGRDTARRPNCFQDGFAYWSLIRGFQHGRDGGRAGRDQHDRVIGPGQPGRRGRRPFLRQKIGRGRVSELAEPGGDGGGQLDRADLPVPGQEVLAVPVDLHRERARKVRQRVRGSHQILDARRTPPGRQSNSTTNPN